MNKPESLRAHLLATVAELKHNPERLLIFIDNGKVRCTAAASLSFEYSFDLQVILTDFAGHPDNVMLPLLGWISVHQSELLENLNKSAAGIQFEADILDNSKVDLSLTLPLTERVVVGKDAEGKTTFRHPGEPQRVAAFLDPSWIPGDQGTGSEWVVPND
ncbi:MULTISPECIES: phage tail protein [Pseudomonas]|uniref:Phage tail protein n=1 Tax=Pseudomonas wuhanensis TaxID=2954098 RepID=A0ABY9GXE9_9PSED|nr:MULTISPECIES: phage tail protein [unclassified Pseudomonas]WLI14429.1 phage tail protein [Pseudomonas sp. FP603]WLI20345.1 phage tail protein [Pseudomonas sp. FP607]